MCKWVFPPNNNAVINGINDAGIATFASTMYDSLVRESIQNSLDAKADWADGPVEVHFTQENIPRNKIPGYESLSEALKKCEVVESNNELTRNFFKTAYETLDFNSINVLKISDYNTTGLKGSSSGKSGTAWSRLVKESGTNDKDGVAGGSFGIGKSAYFACSIFRTVFFSSLSEDNEKSNIGVARLISFDLDNETKSIGMGFYAEGNKLLAIQDLADFDGKPKRTEYGTDIYIIGNYFDSNLAFNLIDSVISNFLVSIYKELLVVYINDVIVDSSYLVSYFNEKKAIPRASLSSEKAELLDYYMILSNQESTTKYVRLNSNEYGSEFGFKDGECELYLKKGDELNRKVLITRKTGMKIFEQGRISSSILFSGILYVSGSNMNKLFREMEGPAHNRWQPNQQAVDYKKQEEAYKKLREYIKNKVNELFSDNIGDEFEAFDVGQFLPDILTNDGDKKESENIILQAQKIKFDVKKTKPSRKKVRSLDSSSKLGGMGFEEISGRESGVGDDLGFGAFHKGGLHNGGWKGSGDNPGNGVTSGEGDLNLQGKEGEGQEKTQHVNYRESTASSSRIICIDSTCGLYRVLLRVPAKAKHVKIEFSIAGEQHDFDVNICSAKLVSQTGNSLIDSIDKNTIYISNVIKNEVLELTVNIDFKGHCMMEVDYYESKK